MKIVEARITEIIPRTHDVKSFRFEPKEKLDFQAGQFMSVLLNVKGQEQQKYLSFSSSPTEKNYWEFTKKITSSDFSQTLNELKSNDVLKIKMPLGYFLLDDTQKIAFLSGGIGITPIRSMWKYIIDKNLGYNIILIYGNRTKEDILFKTEFDQFSRTRTDHRIVYTLDTPPAEPKDWNGRIGYINAKMIREEIPDYNQRKFYVCGPPQMVENITKTLQQDLNIAPSSITKENFTGY